jgi:site-specific DNA-cytosine methylase
MGGLEHPHITPELFCERDVVCQQLLKRRYPDVAIHSDIVDLFDPPSVDIVSGGWPCQDISIAGRQVGLSGTRSGLFHELVRVSKQASAHTLILENVPNLLVINDGQDFEQILSTLTEEGFRYVSWRVLNAREFRLPQDRRRLFIVASRHRERALALHSAIPNPETNSVESPASFGFYWTAGSRSLCCSPGYVPALKIGASDERGRAPVAVFRGGVARKLSAMQFLSLQGFRDLPVDELSKASLLRMAGNAVALPVGHFVFEAVETCAASVGVQSGFGAIRSSGFSDDGFVWMVSHNPPSLATNLDDFLDDSGSELSEQASAGLLVRAVRFGHRMPVELFDYLWSRASQQPEKIQPSRANSFVALEEMRTQILDYGRSLGGLDACGSDPVQESSPIHQ